jgi:hypothetical protein
MPSSRNCPALEWCSTSDSTSSRTAGSSAAAALDPRAHVGIGLVEGGFEEIAHAALLVGRHQPWRFGELAVQPCASQGPPSLQRGR